jgi:DNA-binding NarL/FixJ family response regulator
MRVLIVDDVAVVREGLRLLFSDEPDVEIVGEASNAAEAVARVGELDPDVVLMDIEMPGGDGLHATRAIKTQPHPPAVVVMSVYADSLMRARAREAGADQFVEKDGTLTEIMQTLRAIKKGD